MLKRESMCSHIWISCCYCFFFFTTCPDPNNSFFSWNLTQLKASSWTSLLSDSEQVRFISPSPVGWAWRFLFTVLYCCLCPILCVCFCQRQICSLTQAQEGSLKSSQTRPAVQRKKIYFSITASTVKDARAFMYVHDHVNASARVIFSLVTVLSSCDASFLSSLSDWLLSCVCWQSGLWESCAVCAGWFLKLSLCWLIVGKVDWVSEWVQPVEGKTLSYASYCRLLLHSGLIIEQLHMSLRHHVHSQHSCSPGLHWQEWCIVLLSGRLKG